MPGGNRSMAKPEAAALLAAGQRYDLVAKQVGIHERTLRRWAEDEQFQSRIRVVQSEVVDRAASRLADGMERSATVMVELLDDPEPRIRLGAARAILSISSRIREQQATEIRLLSLEKMAARLNEGGHE